MDADQTDRGGLGDTLRRLGRTAVAVLRNRLELLIVELHEERVRIVHALLLVAVIVSLGIFTLTTLVFAVLFVLWDQLGIMGVFIASGLGFIATAVVYWRLRVSLKNWAFLDETLNEFKKDCEWLKNKD